MDIDRLDLNLLRILGGLYELGRVSAVAHRLKLSQPAVRAGLARLRVFFNDQLFVRAGSGMRPTPFAEELRRPVMAVLQTITEEILSSTAFAPQESRRTFTVCMSDVPQLIFLPRLYQALAREAPLATVRCVNLSHPELVRELEEGRVDLALGYIPQLEGGAIVGQRLFEHEFICLVREGHPRIGNVLDLQAFLEVDHIVVGQRCPGPAMIEGLLREAGLRGRIVLRIADYLSAPTLVARSDLICIAPRALGEAFASPLGVRSMALPISYQPIPLRQFWHRRMHSDAGLVWLRSVVEREFASRAPFPAGR
jgi:DNA-binding transcriptional LysR family regulator